ncbi:GNAT family N-acetyltransferase [Nocardioides lijunqiniae]|uniref:GNAT family N-acetyltransferase n=1 Tax=Nocardioides lijunqiniae TaxID=2760832 RepID=UPI001877C9F8
MGRLSRPVLVTERLRLEPLTHAHTDLLVELDSDPDVLRFVFGRALTREEVVTTWMPRRTRPGADARGLGYWVGHAGDEFLGWWCLGLDDEDPTAAELGYRLRRTAWGRGYATEGARALVAHAFGTVGLDRVWATTMVANDGSRRVLEKAGLHHVRTETPGPDDPDRAVDGWEQGVAVLELTRTRWASSRS